jgi:hypothetical protein
VLPLLHPQRCQIDRRAQLPSTRPLATTPIQQLHIRSLTAGAAIDISGNPIGSSPWSMPRRRIANPRMTAKSGSDTFKLSTFSASSGVNCPRGFMHRKDAVTGDTFAVTVETMSLKPSFSVCRWGRPCRKRQRRCQAESEHSDHPHEEPRLVGACRANRHSIHAFPTYRMISHLYSGRSGWSRRSEC